MELPPFIPLFPLPNVVLFPDVPLPLHVFEPRYRAMVRDALGGAGLIGMVLLRGEWERDYHGAPDVYRTGCAGRIVEATPLPEGKFNIVLTGLREFEIVSEQRERAYRQASVRWRPASPEPLPPDLRGRLGAMIDRLGTRAGVALTRQLLGDVRLDDVTLVNFLAFWLDLDIIEKQCLLEASGETRARRLLALLEFQLYSGEPRAESSGRRVH